MRPHTHDGCDKGSDPQQPSPQQEATDSPRIEHPAGSGAKRGACVVAMARPSAIERCEAKRDAVSDEASKRYYTLCIAGHRAELAKLERGPSWLLA
jgi:hypothetical protein